MQDCHQVIARSSVLGDSRCFIVRAKIVHCAAHRMSNMFYTLDDRLAEFGFRGVRR